MPIRVGADLAAVRGTLMVATEKVGEAGLAAELASRGVELGHVIGRGAIAVVYRAHDTKHES